MRYLALFSQDRPHLGVIAVFDTRDRQWVSNPLCLRPGDHLSSDLEYTYGPSQFYGLLSRHRNLMSGQWVRDRNGQILESEQPRRVPFEEALQMVREEPSLPEPAPRSCHRPRSTPRTFAHRYTPPTIFSAEVISSAQAMRAEGTPWSLIAQRLGVKPESLQATLRKLKRAEASAA